MRLRGEDPRGADQEEPSISVWTCEVPCRIREGGRGERGWSEKFRESTRVENETGRGLPGVAGGLGVRSDRIYTPHRKMTVAERGTESTRTAPSARLGSRLDRLKQRRPAGSSRPGPGVGRLRSELLGRGCPWPWLGMDARMAWGPVAPGRGQRWLPVTAEDLASGRTQTCTEELGRGKEGGHGGPGPARASGAAEVLCREGARTGPRETLPDSGLRGADAPGGERPPGRRVSARPARGLPPPRLSTGFFHE